MTPVKDKQLRVKRSQQNWFVARVSRAIQDAHDHGFQGYVEEATIYTWTSTSAEANFGLLDLDVSWNEAMSLERVRSGMKAKVLFTATKPDGQFEAMFVDNNVANGEPYSLPGFEGKAP